MKHTCLGLVLCIFCLYCSAQNSPFQQAVKHVIVIGVDGMSPDGIIKANTPVMDKMMREGSYTLHARGVLPTTSTPNWASMIMGAGPEQHGFTSNDWQREEYPFGPVVAGREGIFPTIFSVLRNKMPKAEIGVVYDWDGFGRLVEKTCINYDYHSAGERDAANKAGEYIKAKKPAFLFVHLDHVDHAGHELGHGSGGYYKAVEEADSLIGQIIQAARDAGIADETVFIVTADHGGKGKGHGGESLAELEIPFILYGKNIKPNKEILQPVYTYDNAATVAFIFGAETPYAWIGRPIKHAFVGYDDPTGLAIANRVSAPTINPANGGDDPAGGLFIGKQAYCSMSAAKGSIMRYTTDGSEPTATSKLYTDSFLVNASMVIKAKAFDATSSNSETAKAYFRIVPSNAAPKVKYTYYEVDNIEFLPDLNTLKPVSTGTTYEFRIDNTHKREDRIVLAFDATINIPRDGEYRFFTVSDDGSKLYIDGKEVVDNDGDHGSKERGGNVDLKQGEHTIKVTYFNGGGGKWLDVYWRGPDIGKQILAPDYLK